MNSFLRLSRILSILIVIANLFYYKIETKPEQDYG